MEKKIILLVEDNLDEEELIKRALKKGNIPHEIIVMNDPVEALDYLFGTGIYSGRDLRIMPKVIWLDLNLPKMDGLEVLRRLRENQRTKLVPVVMLTASNQQEEIVKNYGVGANSYVRKPVEFSEFALLVQQLAVYWLQVNQTPPVLIL
ncbi:response regulator [Ancylothrix sp. C2]|uniref:response regulator n=1 Tax=Ancylothrix sp. D3o TaxID=2953691 RepID=UPI0021BAE618|nr:response regulator [Ancylothrix sp. D3o]MCT7949449.1 response regulator [Ancylothrix sp. D3o]